MFCVIQMTQIGVEIQRSVSLLCYKSGDKVRFRGKARSEGHFKMRSLKAGSQGESVKYKAQNMERARLQFDILKLTKYSVNVPSKK